MGFIHGHLDHLLRMGPNHSLEPGFLHIPSGRRGTIGIRRMVTATLVTYAFFFDNVHLINRQFPLAMLNNCWMRLWHEWKKSPSGSLGMMLSKMLVGQVPSTQVYEEIHLTKSLNCRDRFSPKGGEVDQSQAAPMLHFHTFPYIFNLDMEATAKKRYVVRPMFGFRPGFLKSRGQVFVGQFPPKGAREMRFGYLLRPSQYQALPKGQLQSLGCLGSWRIFASDGSKT